MTVTVTMADGATEEYMRFGDSYIEHTDGTLDVVRVGSKKSYTYAPGAWADVRGDKNRHSRSHP